MPSFHLDHKQKGAPSSAGLCARAKLLLRLSPNYSFDFLAVDPTGGPQMEHRDMSLGLILVIILVIFLLGGFSGQFGGYGYGYGHGGMGIIGVILVILVVLLLMGRL